MPLLCFDPEYCHVTPLNCHRCVHSDALRLFLPFLPRSALLFALLQYPYPSYWRFPFQPFLLDWHPNLACELALSLGRVREDMPFSIVQLLSKLTRLLPNAVLQCRL